MSFLLALGLVGLIAPQGELPEPIRRERQTRAWAVQPDLEAQEFRAALASESWRARHAALDSLSRARPGSMSAEELGFVAQFLGDEHPNVRAVALEVCVRFKVELQAELPDLATDVFPEMRRQCARALAGERSTDARAQLASLSRDPDEHVAWEGTCALIVAGGHYETQELLSTERFFGEFEDFRSFTRAVDALVRDGDRAAIFGFGRSPEAFADAARYALFYSTVMAEVPSRLIAPSSAGTYKSPLSGKRGALATPDLYLTPWSELSESSGQRIPSRLVHSWLVSFGAESSFAEREGRSRLLSAAAFFSLESALALLERGAELDRRASESQDVDLAWDATQCLEGVHAALAGRVPESGASALAVRGLNDDGSLAWSEDFAVEFWNGMTGACQALDAEQLRPWLAGDVPLDVRWAVIEVAADTWRRTGDVGAAELLQVALADDMADLTRFAVLALVGSSPRELQDLLEVELAAFEAWREQYLLARREDLRDFNRELRFDTPWREELVRLWMSGDARVVSIPELLAGLSGDEDTIGMLAFWFDAELDTLEASEVPDVETTRGPWRMAETRARWLLDAWTKATEHRSFSEAREFLLRVDPLGRELAKIAVASLARTRDGGEQLVELFESEALSRRSRIEIALLVPSLDRVAARDLLIGSYATCDEELRIRTLERLGELEAEDSRNLLLAVVLDAGSSLSERVVALDSLSSAGKPDEVRARLVRVALESKDLDLRRTAIAALGGLGDGDSAKALYQMLDRDPRVEYLRDELVPAIALIELRVTGALSERMAKGWCAMAQQQSAGELLVRFRGERLPNASFVYSDLLGVAGALAAYGQLEAALPEGWESWDARLLIELGAIVTGDVRGPRGLARQINHAALVGLRGEAPASDLDGLLLRVRARLLGIALAAEAWSEIEGWSELILEDWRTGRTTPGAFRAVFGGESNRPHTAWLRATRAQARARLALQAGDLFSAGRQRLEAELFVQESERAQRQQLALVEAISAKTAESER